MIISHFLFESEYNLTEVHEKNHHFLGDGFYSKLFQIKSRLMTARFEEFGFVN